MANKPRTPEYDSLVSARVVTVVLFVALNFVTANLAANEFPPLEPCPYDEFADVSTEGHLTDAPYCGLRCVLIAARQFDSHVQFRTILRPEFVGMRGSTTEQLCASAKAFGLSTAPMYRLTYRSLSLLDSPAVLHVKSSAHSAEFDHWVTLCSWKSNAATIADGSAPPRVVPAADLRAIWDGHAILISEHPPRIRSVQAYVLAELSSYVLAVLVGLMLLRLVASRLRSCVHPAGASIRQTVVEVLGLVGMVAVAAAIGWILGSSLNSDSAIAGVVDLRTPELLSEVTTAQLRREIDEGTNGLVIVDARWNRDYRAGHIPGAISIEPTTTRTECSQILQGVSKNSRIVVYCRVRECSYSGIVARQLVRLGFTDVRIFRDGWLAWHDHGG